MRISHRLSPWPPLHRMERGDGGEVAFTMIEIAICLAVIGFALAAIIGVLPLGLSVQRENREETVINQDSSVILNAIRNGELGLDDLTNYVTSITNTWALYTDESRPVRIGPIHVNGYTYTNSSSDGTSLNGYLPMTNGFGIVGLLSTPRYVRTTARNGGAYYSNYVVAFVRSLSGNAGEKYPQTNADVQALSFTYRMISEIVPYADFDRNWTNFTDPNISGNTNEITIRSNYWLVAKNIQTNLYDLRLIFRYPLLPNGDAGNGRLVFRSSVSGQLRSTNMFNNFTPPYQLFFFEPRTYVRAQ